MFYSANKSYFRVNSVCIIHNIVKLELFKNYFWYEGMKFEKFYLVHIISTHRFFNKHNIRIGANAIFYLKIPILPTSNIFFYMKG